MRGVTGALAATRLFAFERAEVKRLRRARKLGRERPNTTLPATGEEPRTETAEPSWSLPSQTSADRETGGR